MSQFLPGGTRTADVLAIAGQLAVATAGGALFDLAGIPGGWLSGAVIAVCVLAAFGRARPMPEPLSDLGMLLAGVALGAGATPEALDAVARYPLSIGMLLLAILGVTFGSTGYLMLRPGWTREEALLASVPGALSAVFAVAAARGGRLPQIAVVQLFRLAALVVLLPALATGVASDVVRSDTAASMGPGVTALVLGGGLALGMLFQRLRVAAHFLLGAMLVSVAAHLTGLARGGLPDAITTIAFILLGCFIGGRMRGLTRDIVRRSLLDAVVSFGIGLAVSATFAIAVTRLVGIGLDSALLAFAPGGFEAMIVLAILMNVDALYVGAHHIVRFLAIGFLLPVFFRTPPPGGDESVITSPRLQE